MTQAPEGTEPPPLPFPIGHHRRQSRQMVGAGEDVSAPGHEAEPEDGHQREDQKGGGQQTRLVSHQHLAEGKASIVGRNLPMNPHVDALRL